MKDERLSTNGRRLQQRLTHGRRIIRRQAAATTATGNSQHAAGSCHDCLLAIRSVR